MGHIKLTQVQKKFGDVEVIKPLDLSIKEGEFVVFVGPSGCGKSTLLRLIAGLEDVTSGELQIDDVDATTLPPSKRGLAMVFQSYALYPHMTVRKNIAFPMMMAKVPEAIQEKKIAEAAELLNLNDYLDRKPAQLSGGQRQRVAIGRAIVREPSAFLFDEPLSNLDAALRVDMRVGISDLHQKLRSTMIYVTHDQIEAMTLADRIVVLNGGRIEQVGSPLELYDRPKNRFVAGFIGSPKMNFIKGEDYNCASAGIRPEHIEISQEAGAWSGKVIIVEHLGSDTFLYVKTDISDDPMIVRSVGEFRVTAGDTIYMTPDKSKLHLFDSHGNRLQDDLDKPRDDGLRIA